jgi:mono/diheme cytochrome c family protein
MNSRIMAIGLAVMTLSGTANAANFCRINPYTKTEAAQGKVLFDSHCGLCHQYNLTGREPGNFKNEVPDINLLSESDTAFVDGAGGSVPPLIGKKFFDKMQKYDSVSAWSAFVSNAANSFPPKGKEDTPYTYLKIAAYVLYRNCGKDVPLS